jgi:cytochrome d ubiquinol oxidase subunit I
MGTLKQIYKHFGTLNIYRYFCLPLGLLLSLAATITETRYSQSGKTSYKKLARFWRRLFLANATLGLTIKVVQEF